MFKAPKVPKQPLPPERQAMQAPKDMPESFDRTKRRRRGMWASIFTTPSGVGGAPSVTGSGGGQTGVFNG
jgi:hypothetical protein